MAKIRYSKNGGLLEETVLEQIREYLISLGWTVIRIYTGGIPLGRGVWGVNQCKGIPDLICFHNDSPDMMWIEVKKEKGGRVSPEQKKWHGLLSSHRQIILLVNSLECLKQQLKDCRNEPVPDTKPYAA
jgi:hypothetical protein